MQVWSKSDAFTPNLRNRLLLPRRAWHTLLLRVTFAHISDYLGCANMTGRSRSSVNFMILEGTSFFCV